MKPAEILRELKKFPNKVLGQNFLVDSSAVEDMIEAAEVSEDDVVVEVGPGLGALTFPLLTHAKKVIAIEQDREFANYLRLKKARNLTVVTGDALRIDWAVSIDGPYKIVANIPYSITFPLLRKIFLLEHRPQVVVLLVQKEVASRLVAKSGSSDRGIPTIRTEANAKVEIVRKVKSGSFYPRPKVESSIVRLELTASQEDKIFWPAVEAGFSQKRQMLVNCLNKSLKISKPKIKEILKSYQIDEKIRAEGLSFENWVSLSAQLKGALQI